jgi:hypothetical protein
LKQFLGVFAFGLPCSSQQGTGRLVDLLNKLGISWIRENPWSNMWVEFMRGKLGVQVVDKRIKSRL